MATITLPGVLLSGTHAGRPAASAVAAGALYAETDTGQTYQSDGSSTWTAWGAGAGGGYTAPSAPSAIQRSNGSDYSTSSTSYVDLDATNVTATKVFTGTHHVRISFGLACYVSVGTAGFTFGINDGTSDIELANGSIGTATFPFWVANSIILPSTYAAGSHTFKLRYHVVGGATLTVQSTSAAQQVMFGVEELPY